MPVREFTGELDQPSAGVKAFAGELDSERNARVDAAGKLFEEQGGNSPLVRLGKGFKAVDVLGRYLGNKVGLVSDDSLRTAAEDFNVGADPRVERVVNTINDASGFGNTAAALWDALTNDPGAVAGLAVEQLPTMALSLPVGGVLGPVVGNVAGKLGANAGVRAGLTGAGVVSSNTAAQSFPSALSAGLEKNKGDIAAAEAYAAKQAAAEAAIAALFGPLAAKTYGGRVANTLAQGTRGGVSEVAETLGGNMAVGEDTTKGDLLLSGVLGSVMDLPEAAVARRAAGTAITPQAQALADAIDGFDPSVLFPNPVDTAVRQPGPRFDPVAAAQAIQQPAPAVPQLPFDPTVQNPQPVMAVDPAGTVRPMGADEQLDADTARQAGVDTGLTPDVQRAIAARNVAPAPETAPNVPSDLVKRLIDSGWVPPDKGPKASDGNNPNPDPATVEGIGQDLETLYQQDVKDGIKQRLGMDRPPAKGEDKPQSSAFRSFLRGLGIAPELAGDLTGERGFKANNRLPGTFRKGGLQLDEIVTRAVERGFLTDAQVQSTLDNGGTNALVDMIRAELRGERQVSNEVAGEQAQQQMDSQALEGLHRQAEAIGFDTTGLDGDQINLALKRIERRRARVKQFDAKREAKAERQAMTDAQDLSSLDDSDIPWDNDSNVSTEDAMRAMGFSEQEIADATTERPAAAQEDRGGSGAPGQDAAGSAQGTDSADKGSAPGQQAKPVGQAEGLTVEKKIRDAFSRGPVSLGVAKPIVIEHNGVAINFMARQDRLSDGKKPAVIHLTRLKRGRMVAGLPEAWIIDPYKLTGADELVEDGLPKSATDAEAAAFNANFEQEGLTAPTRADVLAQQDRAANAQALDDKAQIDKEAAGQTLTAPTAPEQRKDTSGDMFGLEKAQATIDQRNKGGTEPTGPSLFDAPVESDSIAPANPEQRDRNGLTAADRYATKIAGAAQDLASQIQGDFSEGDFDPAEVRPGLESFARDAGVPADELRQAVLKNLRASDMSKSNLRKVEKALDPTKVSGNTENANATPSGKIDDFGVALYSRPNPRAAGATIDTLRTALTDRFGPLIGRMEARGFLKLWPSTQAFNEGQTSEKIDGPAQGYWDGKVAHLFADGIEPGNEVAVLLHEVGEHASMKKMLGPQAYAKLVERAYDLVDAEDPTAMRAIDRIPDDTPDHYKDSEFLAYMIETVASDGAKATPSARKWLDDIVAAIRAWFSQTGFNKTLDRFGQGIKLTPQDIAALAVRAVRWQAEQGGGGGQFSRGTNSVIMRGTEEQAIAAGFTMRAYRGVDKDQPFNDSGTTWMTTSREVAEAYAEEVMGYDNPGVLEVMVNPDELPRHDASRMTDEQREQLQADDFGNPQAIGIYDRSDDHPLGGSQRNVTVIHAPKNAVFIIDDGGQLSRPSNAAAAAANVFGGIPAAPAATRNAVQQTTTAQPNAMPWAVTDPGRLDNFTRYIQNSRIDIKRTVDAVKAAGQNVADDANPYLMDELYIGKVRAQLDHLADDSIKPLLSAIANSGFKTEQVNEYLWARHAEERNRQMAKVNAVPFTPALDLAGMSTTDANTKLAAYRAMPDFRKLQAIVKMVDQITEDARTKIVTDGLEEPGVIQAWEGAYKHYVPLQRDMEEAGGKASGYNVKGSESRRAVGSKKEAINILANVIAQAEATIIRSEKAAVGRSVLDMARQHPNPDFWTVDTPPTERVIDPRTGLVTNRVKPNYKALDNVFTVKEAGVEHFVTFNESNARAVQFARTLKNMDAANMGPVLDAIGKATRYLAQWVTSRNPLFWMTNFARDVQGVAFNLQSTPLKGQAPAVMANIPQALGGFARLNAGKTSGKWTTLAQEFKDAGGQTGYMDQYRDSVERMDEIVKEVERMGQSKADPRRIARATLDILEGANDTIENGVRLAVYAQARADGISQAQAASIAKNISVNFNRKGNASGVYNALYMFFNANVQGNVRMIQGVMQSRRAQGYAAALTMAGAAVALLNLVGGGDDEETKMKRYELAPEWERERNWIVFIPGTDGYVKVPLPLGPHILFNAGRILAEIGFEDGADPVEKAASFVSSMFSAFNPVGGGFPTADAKGAAQMVTPTIARPVVDLVVNQNFAGTPITRENSFPGYKKPNYLAGRESTAQYWSSAAKALNDWTGGDNIKPGHVNLSPEQLAYLVKGYVVPGIAQTVDTAAKQIMSPKDTPAEQMLGVSKFFGRIDDRARTRAGYDKLREDEQHLGEYKNYIAAGEREKAKQVLAEWGGGSEANGRKLLGQYTVTDRLLASIRKQKRTIAENGDPDTQVQKLEDMNARLNRTLAVYLANTRDLRRKVSASRE